MFHLFINIKLWTIPRNLWGTWGTKSLYTIVVCVVSNKCVCVCSRSLYTVRCFTVCEIELNTLRNLTPCRPAHFSSSTVCGVLGCFCLFSWSSVSLCSVLLSLRQVFTLSSLLLHPLLLLLLLHPPPPHPLLHATNVDLSSSGGTPTDTH